MKNITRIFTAIVIGGLMFAAASAQELKGEWKLVEAVSGGEKVVYNEEIRTTAVFGANNALGGNSGCNRYSTTYKITGERIEFSPIISTKMACPGERMKQETLFFGIMEKVKNYKTQDGFLIFYDKSKKNVLKFAPVPGEKPPNKC